MMDERLEALLAEVPESATVIEPAWEAEHGSERTIEELGRDLERGGGGAATVCPTCGGRATVESCLVFRARGPFPHGLTFTQRFRGWKLYTIRCWKPWHLDNACPPALVEVAAEGPQPEFPPPPGEPRRARPAPLRFRLGERESVARMRATWEQSLAQEEEGAA